VKTKFVVLSLGVLAMFLMGVLGFGWWKTQLNPVSTDESPVAFVVIPGESGIQTANKLTEAGLARSVLVTRIYMKAMGIESKVQPGSFVLQQNMSLPEIFNQLLQGPQDIWVTIPEGWRREQVAERMSARLGDENFIVSEFLKQTEDLEGQLFPDTYLIPAVANASDVVRIMSANFKTKSGLNMPSDTNILILASLIEREGKSATDRPGIAGVLTNRLDAGWPLQVDATVQYARGNANDWWPTLTDTKFSSIYNTYIHTGLPPTPIASPGLESIQAALDPDESEYWYYIHAPDGSVHFGRNLNEHNANIDKYLRP
jgi:UPF0755 protein